MFDEILRQLAAEHEVACRHLALARAERDIIGHALDELIAEHASETSLVTVDALYGRLIDAADEAQVRAQLTGARYYARVALLEERDGAPV